MTKPLPALPDRACALACCGKIFAPKMARMIFCKEECVREARHQRARERGTIRGAQGMSAYWASRREVAAEAPVVDPRQQPLARPRHVLRPRNFRVVIAPDCPAPPRYMSAPLFVYWDDLNAIADHGSPGLPPRPDFWHGRTVSVLA